MDDVFSISLPVFGIVALGYGAGRRGLSGSDALTCSRILSAFVYFFCMPALIFGTMIKSHTAFNPGFLGAFAASFACTAALAFGFAGVCFDRSRGARVLSVMAAAHSNAAYLGVPIMYIAYAGDLRPAVQILTLQVAVITPIYLIALEHMEDHAANGTASVWREIVSIPLRNPIILATVCGLLVGHAEIAVPEFLRRSCELLGSSGMACGLFALGLSLCDARMTDVRRSEIALLSVLKLCIAPLLAYLFGRYVFQLPPMELGAVTLMAAMPSAMNSFIFASRYRTFTRETSATVLVTSVLGVCTLSLLILYFDLPAARGIP